MESTQFVGGVCALIGSIPHTTISTLWFIIGYVFSTYWYFLIPALIIWFILEFVFRFRNGFKSENGFTPFLNSFIGGGIYYISNALVSWILNLLFGPITDCSKLWVSSFYIIPFLITALFLYGIGFWPYIKDPFTGKKLRRHK